MNQIGVTASKPIADPRRVVRILSKERATAGVLVRDETLDASGETVSVLGCKSGILGRRTGETILVAFADGTLAPAVITHIHAVHDRFRASIDTIRLPNGLEVGELDTLIAGKKGSVYVEVADPG